MFKNKLVILSGLTSIIAGIFHASIVAIQHKGIAPEMMFFLFFGILQIAWAVWFIKYKKDSVFHVGLLLNGGLMVVWILTRIFPAPFIDEPEPVNLLGSLVVSLEIISIGALVLWHQSSENAKSLLRVLGFVVVISFLSGLAMYAGGKMGEKLFPDIEPSHSHSIEEAESVETDSQNTDTHMNSTELEIGGGVDDMIAVPMRHDNSDEHHDN